ncbi:hypothetical protein ACOME3_000591 [Neoechinorhynchus agilis]
MTNRMEKVDLLNANCRYSTIQFDDGHKSIIPTKELALYSNNEQESEDGEISHLSANNNAPQDYENEETEDETHAGTDELSLESPTAIQQPRRSSRLYSNNEQESEGGDPDFQWHRLTETAKYLDLANVFALFGVETYGSLGSEALQLLRDLKRRLQVGAGDARSIPGSKYQHRRVERQHCKHSSDN